MKNLFATCFILFLLTGFSQAQELENHYIATETHDTIVSTNWVTIDKSETLLLSFRMTKHNSQYALELKYNFGKGPVFSVRKGDSVMIKFISGWGFSVFAGDSVVSKVGLSSYPGSLNGAVTEGVHVLYPLTIGEIAAFKSEAVEKMRLYTSRGFDNCIFPKYKRADLSAAAVAVSQIVTDWQIVKYKEDYHPDTKGQKEDKW